MKSLIQDLTDFAIVNENTLCLRASEVLKYFYMKNEILEDKLVFAEQEISLYKEFLRSIGLEQEFESKSIVE